jgi:citrate lyase gamma subunit
VLDDDAQNLDFYAVEGTTLEVKDLGAQMCELHDRSQLLLMRGFAGSQPIGRS